MAREPKLLLFGQDTAGGVDAGGDVDCWGGVLGVTKGLYSKYGDRVIDAPPTEMAYVGAAVGAALSGVPVVAEVPFIDFMGVCFDQHVREGRDVSSITYGPMVPRALEAATQLAKAGVEADIMAQVVEKRFSSLKSAPQMVSAPHTPVPFSPLLEEAYIPGATQIVAAVKRAMGHKA
ncbi:MAG: hypothetical protein M3Z59_03115 [Bombella apis]|nr:hypothetical protein [Bombella apis]